MAGIVGIDGQVVIEFEFFLDTVVLFRRVSLEEKCLHILINNNKKRLSVTEEALIHLNYYKHRSSEVDCRGNSS